MLELSVYRKTLLQVLGKETSSGDNFLNSSLNVDTNLIKSSSDLFIMIDIASLILPRQISGVDDLIASTPITLSFGCSYLTPSSSNKLSIYRFLATHIPLFAITSRFIIIFWSYAFTYSARRLKLSSITICSFCSDTLFKKSVIC